MSPSTVEETRLSVIPRAAAMLARPEVRQAAMAWSSLAGAQVPNQPPAGEVDTLREALVQTYATNPTIMAERAQLRGTDESVALARAEGRPQADPLRDA